MTAFFRFIVTHPDMDHIDGIEAFFTEFSPLNFWDTDNNKECDSFGGGYSESDCGSSLRIYETQILSRALNVSRCFAERKGKYWNEGATGAKAEMDCDVQVAPTSELIAQANECGKFNDSSYVIEYLTSNYKVLFFWRF